MRSISGGCNNMGNVNFHDKGGGHIRMMRDLRSKTNFSRDALEALKKRFDTITPDNNLMSKTKFLKVLEENGFGREDRGVLESIFEVFDHNNNGIVSFTEMVTVLSLLLNTNDSTDTLKVMFDLYDVAGSNYITKEEMIRVLDALNRVTEIPMFAEANANPLSPRNTYARIMKFVDEVFEREDRQMDGRLSFAEFEKAMQDYPVLVNGACSSLKEVFRKVFSAGEE